MAMCIWKPNLFGILCVEEAQAEDFSSERTQQKFFMSRIQSHCSED